MAEPVTTQSLPVDDFSGGITDNYIANPDSSKFESADNFFLVRYGQKAKLITSRGSEIYDEDYPRIPGSTRLSGLAECEGTLFQYTGKKLHTITGAGWSEITGPTSNSVFDQGSTSSYLSSAKWNKHLLISNDAYSYPQKVFKSGSSWVSRTLGLPAINEAGITCTPSAGGNTYLYAFIRSDSYTIGTVTYREVSAVSGYKTVSSAAAPTTLNPIAITGIPVLSNSTTGNYNTSTSKVEIYRTITGGSVFYKVGEVTNGTTSFNDTVSDATLLTNEALYTTGDISDFEQAPQCKYVIISGDTAFFLGVKEGSQTLGSRVRQSIPGAPYASPSDFYVDLSADIVGGAVINGTPIVFCENKRVYRLEGLFSEDGSGGIFPREISNTIELCSHRSLVETPEGLFGAFDSGFYVTRDGYTFQKISAEFNTTYSEIVINATQRSQIYGAYDPVERRVWWAVKWDLSSQDNDTIFVAHLEWPNIPFTTLSGADYPDNYQPTSLIFFNGKMLRGDRRGYLFKHDPTNLTHPKIDTTTTPDLWAKQAIVYDYRSCAYDFGSSLVRKWVPRIVVNADNETNLSLLVSANTDNTGVFSDLSEIRFQGNAPWDDPDGPVWNGDGIRWNYAAVISQWRRFPSPIRCQYRQVRLTNAKTTIQSTNTHGTVSTDTAANTVTLIDNTKEWSANAVDYYISFGEDNYTNEWLVTSRTSNTVLALDDSAGTLTTGANRSFKLRGKKKSDLLSLLSYEIQFGYLTMSQTTYRTQG